jgi:hypothetical protein
LEEAHEARLAALAKRARSPPGGGDRKRGRY